MEKKTFKVNLSKVNDEGGSRVLTESEIKEKGYKVYTPENSKKIYAQKEVEKDVPANFKELIATLGEDKVFQYAMEKYITRDILDPERRKMEAKFVNKLPQANKEIIKILQDKGVKIGELTAEQKADIDYLMKIASGVFK